MLSSLSFKADPPVPFHTYKYHWKKAIKEGYIDNQLDPEKRSGMIRTVLDGLIEIFTIPEDFHVILLRENGVMFKSLASLARVGIITAGTPVFSDRFLKYADNILDPDILSKDLPKKGRKILVHWDPENEKTVNLSPGDLKGKDICEMSLIIQDIDPMTGRKPDPDDLKRRLDFKTLSFIHLDISSSSPTDPLDYENIQSFSFETKYGFGMDQDLVVWILREDLFNLFKEKFSDTFIEIDHDAVKSNKCIFQPELEIPRIYVLGKLMQDFLNRGIKIIRNEIRYKSIILYNSISNNPNLTPLVKDPYFQSQNILCANTEIPRAKLFEFMSGNRIELDVIAGPVASSNIRVANYPVHSKEQMEFLVDCIEKL